MFRVLVIVLFARGILCCEQETFKNTIVTAYVDETDSVGKNLSVNGCLSFLADTYERIECNTQSVLKMFKGAVANLATSIMIFNDNGLEEIEPGAFDLPGIIELDLSRNRIRLIKQGVFGPLVTLKILNLDNNLITEIEAGAFANMAALKQLSVQNNMLTFWNTKWFLNNMNFETIKLNGNLLDFLPSNAIKEIPKVANIHLSKNKLTGIHPNALADTEKLDTLDLSENLLKKLPSNLFSSFNVRAEPRDNIISTIDSELRAAFAGIRNLYLHKNNLTYLPRALMNDLSANNNILYINLHSNPWHCACYNIIERWIRNRSANVDIFNTGCFSTKNPLCVVPDKNPYKCVEDVDEQIYSIYYATYKEATEVDRFDVQNVRC